MTDYNEFRRLVCSQCDGYQSECNATDENIEDCIYAASPLEKI